MNVFALLVLGVHRGANVSIASIDPLLVCVATIRIVVAVSLGLVGVGPNAIDAVPAVYGACDLEDERVRQVRLLDDLGLRSPSTRGNEIVAEMKHGVRLAREGACYVIYEDKNGYDVNTDQSSNRLKKKKKKKSSVIVDELDEEKLPEVSHGTKSSMLLSAAAVEDIPAATMSSTTITTVAVHPIFITFIIADRIVDTPLDAIRKRFS